MLKSTQGFEEKTTLIRRNSQRSISKQRLFYELET
jgi:hypothetical protein